MAARMSTGVNVSVFNEWRARVDTRLQAVETATDVVQATVTRIEASMPSRNDVTEAAKTRLDVQTYTIAHQALVDRVTRLETGPQRLVPWLSVGIGCLSLLVGGAAVIATFIGVAVSLAITLTH